MSLFDILGPAMIGPSSSHTAGAVRLGNLVRMLAGIDTQLSEEVSIISVEFVLYNSFAQTYRGHGTDRGLLAGLLGLGVDDERIREAYALADAVGLQYHFTVSTGKNHYSPNTVQFKLRLNQRPQTTDFQELNIVGHSVGGGKVYVSKINQHNVSLKGELPTLLMFYRDVPGMIWRVTKTIADEAVNIATLQCSRDVPQGEATMTIAMDSCLSKAGVMHIRSLPDVHEVWSLDRLP